MGRRDPARPEESAPGNRSRSCRRADHDLEAPAKGVEHGKALFEPSADAAVGEIAAGLTVAGIVEARHRPAILLRPAIERLRLGTPHIGLEAAQPEQAG